MPVQRCTDPREKCTEESLTAAMPLRPAAEAQKAFLCLLHPLDLLGMRLAGENANHILQGGPAQMLVAGSAARARGEGAVMVTAPGQ